MLRIMWNKWEEAELGEKMKKEWSSKIAGK